VYPNISDVRVPKKAFEIYFHAEGQDDSRKLEERGADWTKLDRLYTGITTWSSVGIFINGVHMKQDDGKGRVQWAKLHTGDVITIFDVRGSKLSFECQFFLDAGSCVAFRSCNNQQFLKIGRNRNTHP